MAHGHGHAHRPKTYPTQFEWLIKKLYADGHNIRALIIHFTLNALIGLLFASLFIWQLDVSANGIRIVVAILQIVFLFVSVKTCINVDTYQGYLLNFMGTNTHEVLENGIWPMIFYPIFRVEKEEKVDFQMEAAKIPETVMADNDQYGFTVWGFIPYHIADEDAERFTASDAIAFMQILTTSGLNAALSTFQTNKYLDVTTQTLRDMKQFNLSVLAGIDTTLLKTRYGITVDTPLLTYTMTEQTKKDFALKTTALNTVVANKNLGIGFANLVIEYKQKLVAAGMTCTDEEARTAVNEALNGKTIYDFGKGGGDGIRLLNINPTTKTK